MQTNISNGTSVLKSGCEADSKLLDLVRLRAAQIYQSIESIEFHTKQLRLKGDSTSRLKHLEQWENCNLFDGEERAALALCERISLDLREPTQDLWIRKMRHHLTKKQIVDLTVAITAVDDWHRLHHLEGHSG
jgi:alkylhydroperoxidase family enzyme